MKLISRGGADSRYSPPGSVEAYYLALKTNFIYGLAVDVYFTKDQRLVSFTEANFRQLVKDSEFIKTNSLETIQKHNIGTKVKKHCVASIEQIMALFSNTDKILILDLKDQQEANPTFVRTVMELAEKYPLVNLYVKSCTKEIVELLRCSRIRAKIGIVINDENLDLFQASYDFYSIATHKLNRQEIENRLRQYDGIMFQPVNDRDTFRHIVKQFPDYTDQIFMITDHVGLLNALNIYDLEQVKGN